MTTRASRQLVAALLAGLLVLWPRLAPALTGDQALAVAEGTVAERVQAITQLAAAPDPAAAVLLRALQDERVRVHQGSVWIERDDARGQRADSGAIEPIPPEAEAPLLNNRLRAALALALAALDLQEADVARQRAAAVTLRRALLEEPDEAFAPLLRAALAPQRQPALDGHAAALLAQALAAVELADADPVRRGAAAAVLGESGERQALPLLQRQRAQETDPAVVHALRQAEQALQRTLALAEVGGTVFTGLSLGSILLLAALGLAITYGLMGVINMAHGELIMVGAYATYVVQQLFARLWPQWFDWYVLAALPVAFFATALVGAAIERGVIRHLYGRPLETLLATWGLSLILMQAVRSLFGAQNVTVENPAWLSGALAVPGGLVLPWNRIAILVFAAAVLLAVAWVLARTRLGLFVRGVTQNRPMAACMGVPTGRVDALAFAFGSGVAGLAGVALSQIGNVGPDLGQSYIIDSFMVVVVGGVGQLAGTVLAAMGLGLLNKLLEGWAGAVLAKIAVLVLIVIFIQKRPQGLFALKGRQA
ncbi:High-affinity branched-chain amino acid transport system permease protein LivH [Tepidimonas thermarum]|uniref:High-affinity branched-chain amino acid transport system permease protein LivH n=1 Tax=Tepidimonas thermarum TaxID=335431 RepID=A0A554X2Z2_9BURK|nr:urea ABC transporter permease subunit UrtB [Tepidimonas thermarum]TSE30221.1 High-affinity branched-chain amino acid transport system permease protein LivH [Tepidimonas thermarum]